MPSNAGLEGHGGKAIVSMEIRLETRVLVCSAMPVHRQTGEIRYAGKAILKSQHPAPGHTRFAAVGTLKRSRQRTEVNLPKVILDLARFSKTLTNLD